MTPPSPGSKVWMRARGRKRWGLLHVLFATVLFHSSGTAPRPERLETSWRGVAEGQGWMEGRRRLTFRIRGGGRVLEPPIPGAPAEPNDRASFRTDGASRSAHLMEAGRHVGKGVKGVDAGMDRKGRRKFSKVGVGRTGAGFEGRMDDEDEHTDIVPPASIAPPRIEDWTSDTETKHAQSKSYSFSSSCDETGPEIQTYEDLLRDKTRNKYNPIEIPEELRNFPDSDEQQKMGKEYRERCRERWVIRRISDTLRRAVDTCEDLDLREDREDNDLIVGLARQLENLTVADPEDSAYNARTCGDDSHSKVDREYVKTVIAVEQLMEQLREEHNYKGLDLEYLEYDQELWGVKESRRRMRQLLQKAKYIKWQLDTAKWWKQATEYVKSRNTTILREYGIEAANLTELLRSQHKHAHSPFRDGGEKEANGTKPFRVNLTNIVSPPTDKNDVHPLMRTNDPVTRAKEMVIKLCEIVKYLREHHKYDEFDYYLQELLEDIGDEYFPKEQRFSVLFNVTDTPASA